MPRKTRNAAFELPDAQSMGGKSWFFGIGINKYKNFSDLNNAVKDVQDMMALLQEQYDVDPEHTEVLFDEKATRRGIIDGLEALESKVGPNDKVIIYYSGHGHLNKTNERGYWIPSNAERDSTAGYINNTDVRESIKTLKSLHTLLISDSCFSGSLFVRGTSRSIESLSKLENIPSRWAISSGRHDEEVYDGDKGGNSPFAKSIINTLRRNVDRKFNVSKLVEQVMEQTSSNYPQMPEGNPLYGVGHEGGQYVFRRRADEAEDWATAQAAAAIPAIQQYLENHPNGNHAGEARERIAYLEEDEAWQNTIEAKEISAYLRYRTDFPSGRYSQQALAAIGELEEEQSWQFALRRNQIYAYEQYREKYPNGKYQKEAKAAVDAIINRPTPAQLQAEDRHWTAAEAENSVASYRRYLGQYPKGRYADKAGERQAELEEQARQDAAEKKRIEREQKEEDRYWQATEKEDSLKAYQAYLGQYPNGRYAEKARAGQSELEARAQRAAAEKERVEQERKEEDNRWQATEQVGSLKAYQAYLGQYPQGRYADQSRERQAELEEQARRAAAEKERIERERKEEELRWQATQQEDSREAYQTYLGQYPQGRYADQARERQQKLEKRAQRAAAREERVKHNPVLSILPGPLQTLGVVPLAGVALVLILAVGWGLSTVLGADPKPAITMFEADGKFGYLNQDGELLLTAIYETAEPFENGRARVTVAGETFTIDEKGTCLADCPQTQEEKAEEAWNLALAQPSIEVFEKFLRNFPVSQFDSLANKKIAELTAPVPPKPNDETPVVDGTKGSVELAGQTYPTIRLRGLTWMAENLNYPVSGRSWIWGENSSAANNEVNRKKYGLLYTWKGAKDACETLGWRLPTDEEWRAMALPFGGVSTDDTNRNSKGSRAYRALLPGGDGGFNAQFGGYRHSGGTYANLTGAGHYWADTYASPSKRVDFKFNKNQGRLIRETGNSMTWGFSCRCVKD